MKEYPYKYEMHCHTNWCSACAHNGPEEMAEAYYKAGYAGMVITDHFLRGNTAVDRSLPWEEKMRCYWRSYEAAKAWAKGKGFQVLFGIEHYYGDGKEVLTYGIGLDFLLAHPDLHMYTLADYSKAVHEAGGFLSQAHPYRHASNIDPDVAPQPQYLDAAEVFNACNTLEENRMAAQMARENGLLVTAGGDVHSVREGFLGKAGLAFATPPQDVQELVRLLRAGDYKLVIEGELQDKGWGLA